MAFQPIYYQIADNASQAEQIKMHVWQEQVEKDEELSTFHLLSIGQRSEIWTNDAETEHRLVKAMLTLGIPWQASLTSQLQEHFFF